MGSSQVFVVAVACLWFLLAIKPQFDNQWFMQGLVSRRLKKRHSTSVDPAIMEMKVFLTLSAA